MLLLLGKNSYLRQKFISASPHKFIGLGREDFDYYDYTTLKDFIKK